MMNRLRTVLVSVTAVAVTMMVLGSNAQAQSVSTASPQNYLRFLQGLREMKKGDPRTQRLSPEKEGKSLEKEGKSLMQLLSGLEKKTPQTARLYKEEMWVFSRIQKNITALVAIEAELPPRAAKELKSIQTLVVKERGVATPLR